MNKHLHTCDIKTLPIEEIMKQCNVCIENLNSGCVKCNEKALQFYVSVNRYMYYLKEKGIEFKQ